MIAELHRVGNVADADIALRGRDDLARLHSTTTLDQFAIEPRLLEISDTIGHKLRLINRDSDGIDYSSACLHSSRGTACQRRATACNERQRGSSRDIGHQACSL